MKKLLLLVAITSILLSQAQGTETFDNFTGTLSYSDGTFTGQDGSTWSYTQSRGDKSITGKSLMLGRDRSPQSVLYSGTISGGIGTISFNYQQAFSTPVNLNILINDVVYANVTTNDTAIKNSGNITVNQPGDVVIKFINVNNSDGQVTIDDISWTSYTNPNTPTLSITSPSNNSTFTSGTASVDVEFTTSNTSPTDKVNITVNGGATNVDVASPFSINTSDGESYTVLVELVDSEANILDSETINFEVLFPCNLNLETINTTCDTETGDVDTFTTTINFTGGGTTTYSINTNGVGIVGGDNPSTNITGTIIITNVDEDTDFTINITGNPSNSSCNLTENINAPSCSSLTCANEGDIIITEIMQNPSAVLDANGEYFEVYNTTESPINMFGWTISDAGTDSHTIASSLIVPAHGYAVLGINADSATNGGVTVNYEYSSFSLTNGDDEIILSCSEIIIDQVFYDGGPNFPDPNGASMELALTAFNNSNNDSSLNWGEATTTFGDGDFGTPGFANNYTLSTQINQIEGFSMYPNPTSVGYINLTSRSNFEMAVTVFDLLGKQVLNTTVTNKKLDVSSLKSGIYILKVKQNDAICTQKLVIQ